jgi:DNA-binding ferritin-like protein
MAIKSLFPEEMIKSSSEGLTLESIAAKLTYFHEQLHLLHWQTTSFAEHQALGTLYDDIQDFKDDVVEKLMGYMGRRVKAFKFEPIVDTANAMAVVSAVQSFAYELEMYAEANKFCDVENMAQDLSGKAAKTKYLLTLS